jgi:hypothetical protein
MNVININMNGEFYNETIYPRQPLTSNSIIKLFYSGFGYESRVVDRSQDEINELKDGMKDLGIVSVKSLGPAPKIITIKETLMRCFDGTPMTSEERVHTLATTMLNNPDLEDMYNRIDTHYPPSTGKQVRVVWVDGIYYFKTHDIESVRRAVEFGLGTVKELGYGNESAKQLVKYAVFIAIR